MAMEKTLNFIIEEEFDGTRIDLVLSLLMSEVSRSYIQKLLKDGLALRNDKPITSKGEKAFTGDKISITLPVPKDLEIKGQDIPLDIIYEDDSLLIVNKAKGMVVHPGPGNYENTLVHGVLYHCQGRLSSINGTIRPGIVHRIDKDTSGLLMIAKTDKAHQSLAKQLEDHTITRIYHAVVYHNIIEDEGTIDAKIGRDPNNRLKQKVLLTGGRRAVTHYKVIKRFGSFTYIEARLETGRTHQIRVHMAYKKHPLLGDLVYGPKKGPINVNTQVLHAKTLGFSHPITGKRMEFDSPLPDEFQGVLKKLSHIDSAGFPKK
jgi:23S rRNA pseudouridine1911/1915/1917 synthase